MCVCVLRACHALCVVVGGAEIEDVEEVVEFAVGGLKDGGVGFGDGEFTHEICGDGEGR